jgi:hypothetical protein
MVEDDERIKIDLELLMDAGQEGGNIERVATGLKEIGVSIDLAWIPIENLAEQVAEVRFQLAGRAPDALAPALSLLLTVLKRDALLDAIMVDLLLYR